MSRFIMVAMLDCCTACNAICKYKSVLKKEVLAYYTSFVWRKMFGMLLKIVNTKKRHNGILLFSVFLNKF